MRHTVYRTVAHVTARMRHRDETVRGTAQLMMVFDAHDPFAVVFTFGDEPWMFARDLLAESLNAPGQIVGHGDVKLRTTRRNVTLELTGLDGVARATMMRPQVAEFLAATYAAVQAGAERAGVDECLALLGVA